MRALLVAAALLVLAPPALSQRSLPRVPEGVPPIMVDPDAPAKPKAKSSQKQRNAAEKDEVSDKERKAADKRKQRATSRVVRRAPVVVPRSSDGGSAGINRSLEVQGQQMRVQQQQQFEINQMRDSSLRSSPPGGGSLSCSPGSLGC